MTVLDLTAARTLLPPRDEMQPKWSFGRAMLVCGCGSMSGAALLSCEAALRSGAGLVQLCAVPPVIDAARPRLPEALLLPLPMAAELPGCLLPEAAPVLLQEAEKADALLFGCGVSTASPVSALLQSLCESIKCPAVIDADGINLLSARPALLSHLAGRIILTPHHGEFCRLSGMTRDQLAADPAGAAQAFAKKTGTVIALKGAVTFITDGVRVFRLEAPNSGMAKGGSGDVLAGLTVGLLAQGLPPLDAAALAAWLHSAAGRLARDCFGARAMLPSDVLSALPQAFSELEKTSLF